MTSQLIADQSMQGMADVVRFAPGVSMGSGEGHRDAPTIRGNSTTADFFVDGLRDDGQYLRDLYNAERIEVLQGPDAMTFGRGGGGGVINRVTRQAQWTPTLSGTVEGGSFDHRRGSFDAGRVLSSRLAGRMDGVLERSGGFRDRAELVRYGVNPTVAALLDGRTLLRLGYEHFQDTRRVDRGIPSFDGRPAAAPIAVFFGNPAVNRATSTIDRATMSVERQASDHLVLRDHMAVGAYDLFYQNTYPGAVTPTGNRVALAAYSHAVPRHNILNSADAVFTGAAGRVRHAIAVGSDLSVQRSSQRRLTGYFGDSTPSYSAPFAAPTVDVPVVFRAAPTDADGRTLVTDAGTYVQDRLELASWVQMMAGVRYERFRIRYQDNRSSAERERSDAIVSPRLGLVLKAGESVSAYASYGVSALPSAGDQFASLSVTAAALAPERFTSREVGVKWDVASRLMLTSAAYRLDRTNTASPDPVTPGLLTQTGRQRTTGWEAAAVGTPSEGWQVASGAAVQRAIIVSTTSAAKAGSTVPLVPHVALSLWNRYRLSPTVGLGLGATHQTAVFAAIDNRVVLPGYTRVDGAVYVAVRPGLRAQLHVENLLDRRYYATSQGNNNIMPGAPRTIRLSLTASR